MTGLRIISSFLVLSLARVEGFGVQGPRSIFQVVTFDSPNPFTSGPSYRLMSTKLWYRNTPHDTQVNYYNILGVPRTANDAEIKRAYRNLAKRFHPDANPDMDTTAIFQQLNRAYEVLKDRDLRAQFDTFGSNGIGTSFSSDDSVRAKNIRRPDEVYYNSYSSPFSRQQSPPHPGHHHHHNHHYHHPQQPPPPPPPPPSSPRPEYERYYGSSDVHAQRMSSPGAQQRSRSDIPYGDHPYGNNWDPWRSPFADVYNAQMEKEGFAPGGSTSSTSHSYTGNNAKVNFENINVGGQRVRTKFDKGERQPYKSTSKSHFMGDAVDFTSAARPNTSFGSGTRRRWVGADLCIEMEIDHETALQGGEEKIRIKHMESCTSCAGDGIHPEAEVKICEHCGGSGAVLHKAQPVGMSATDNMTGHEVCPQCRGTGQKVAENCDTCHGKGTNEKAKEITLVIPPGVGDGTKLRLKGEGDAGPMGGPAGDLFIFVKIKNGSPHARVRMP
mmetsp:Transcript_33340/g.95659  ORF Transcript_33340/g.95659 Transcript_33340/m.95659 type:complete len:498 (+) Transcript_33340:162-1655(+)